jgi:hypothetical protein
MLYEKYDTTLDIWGEPQEYRGIKFYPIKLKDLKYQKLMYGLFGYPKNYIPDKTILKLSYLKFLFYVVQPALHKTDIKDELIEFFKFVTRSENVTISENIDDVETLTIDDIYIKVTIDGLVIYEDQMEMVREMILKQNGISVDYIEEYNTDLEEKLKFLNKNNDFTFEEEIFTFCSMMKRTIHEIQEYTLYQFKNHMERLFLFIDFELFKPLEMSGQISLKDGKKGEIIKHYLSHIPQTTHRYDAILIQKDKYVAESDIFKASGMMDK